MQHRGEREPGVLRVQIERGEERRSVEHTPRVHVEREKRMYSAIYRVSNFLIYEPIAPSQMSGDFRFRQMDGPPHEQQLGLPVLRQRMWYHRAAEVGV